MRPIFPISPHTPRRLLAVAATLVVALACLSFTGLTAAAAATPDAAQIEAFLAEHDSPMTGTGAVFVREGFEHGVDPAFLVAIAGAESSFGRYLYSENGDTCTYNAFNWFYGATRPQSDFISWTDAIARVADGLAGSLYYGDGLYSVQAIAPRYCPVGTAEWISNVTAFMGTLGGNPGDTRLSRSATAPATQPGLIALDGSVELSPRARYVGQTMTARFTIANRGGAALTVEGIRLAVRGPSDVSRDMASDTPLTLAPGEVRAVTASWQLDLVGTWRGWIEVEQNGAPSLVGDEEAFAFSVSLPPELQERQAELRGERLERAN